jgi:carbon-monoxide dehydrogenase iron sulfur subunit
MIKRLKTYDANCIGCLSCTNVCSYVYFKQENPDKSSIQVEDRPDGTFHLVTCDQTCRLCVAECPTLAISVSSQGVVMINRTLCIHCFACVAVCPIQAMRSHPDLLVPFKCIACGQCAEQCPSKALEIVTEEAQG